MISKIYAANFEWINLIGTIVMSAIEGLLKHQSKILDHKKSGLGKDGWGCITAILCHAAEPVTPNGKKGFS